MALIFLGQKAKPFGPQFPKTLFEVRFVARMTVIYLDKRNVILAVAALTGTFIIGILIGTFGISSTTTNNSSNNNHPVNNARSSPVKFL